MKPERLNDLKTTPIQMWLDKDRVELLAALEEAQQQKEMDDKIMSVQDRHILEAQQTIARQREARTIDEWHEDFGDVLWWTFPIQEPPYCGSPLDVDWPDYHTHWTPIIEPENKEMEGETQS